MIYEIKDKVPIAGVVESTKNKDGRPKDGRPKDARPKDARPKDLRPKKNTNQLSENNPQIHHTGNH